MTTATLHVDIVETSSGNDVTLTKQAAAKYFIHYGMNDFAIDQSFNSSSITDEGTGHALLNFTNNMAAVRYSFGGYSNNYSTDTTFSSSHYGMGIDYDAGTTKTATTGMGMHAYHSGSSIDAVVNTAQTFGDLA